MTDRHCLYCDQALFGVSKRWKTCGSDECKKKRKNDYRKTEEYKSRRKVYDRKHNDKPERKKLRYQLKTKYLSKNYARNKKRESDRNYKRTKKAVANFKTLLVLMANAHKFEEVVQNLQNQKVTKSTLV